VILPLHLSTELLTLPYFWPDEGAEPDSHFRQGQLHLAIVNITNPTALQSWLALSLHSDYCAVVSIRPEVATVCFHPDSFRQIIYYTKSKNNINSIGNTQDFFPGCHNCNALRLCAL